MQTIDQTNVKGSLELEIFYKEKPMKRICENNLIVDLGKELLAKLLGGFSIEKIAFVGVGTNGTKAEGDNGSLAGQVLIPVMQANVSGSSVVFRFNIDETTANGIEIREFGLFGSEGTMFARRISETALAKDPEMRIEGNWTIQF